MSARGAETARLYTSVLRSVYAGAEFKLGTGKREMSGEDAAEGRRTRRRGHPKPQTDAGPDEAADGRRARHQNCKYKHNFFSTGLGVTLGVRGIRRSALYRDKYGSYNPK